MQSRLDRNMHKKMLIIKKKYQNAKMLRERPH